MTELKAASGSQTEDLFIELFAETFGADKAGYLYSQYPFFDIYQNARFADFVCESGVKRIAIEIDDEASHNPRLVSGDKYTDDLLKQNSMVHLGWDIYRWTVRQMQKQPDTVKDELRLFLGNQSKFREIDDYLPSQRGQAISGEKLELREYQQEALNNLQAMRERKETIALLYQATGTGKTVTAVMDAKRVGGRTLFVAHTMELVNQAYNTFKSLWRETTVGKFADSVKDTDCNVICGSIQSIALNLDSFNDSDFDYIIIDEAHHATAETYQKVLAYFKPKFILGLTATPERADEESILDIFKNTAHKTVVFCASIKHAEEIAGLFRDSSVNAVAVSGSMKTSERNEWLAKFASGEVKVLCACDLLNEGWDCPQTEVLFMARPTMSKVLYTQQFGRGMRLSNGKEFLMVFDFVDNASQYNAPYSLHRLFKLKDYHAGATVLGKKGQREAEAELYAKGERPDAVVDYPVDATDYEAVDIFNWQEEAAGMISQMEFVRRVDVQSETIEKYLCEGKLIPDLIVPMSEHKSFKYFNEETLERYAQEFGWQLIDDANRKNLFMKMVEQMDMSYSYKPILLKAILKYADKGGRVKIDDMVVYFKSFYESRRDSGLIVEKANSIFAKGGYTDKEAERNILSNPFKRFEDMDILRHTKTLGIIEVDSSVWKKLTNEDKTKIAAICEEKLCAYYKRIE